MALPVAMQRLDVAQIKNVLVILALRPTIGETSTYSCILQRLNVTFRVLAASDVVAPVVHGRHPRMDGFRGGQACSLIHVIRSHNRAITRDCRKIAVCLLITGEAAK